MTGIFGNNRIEVQDERGHKSVRRSAHVKYIAPSEKVVKQLPSEQLLKNYGRSLKLLLAEKDIPDLYFHVTEVKEEGDSVKKTEVMEIMDDSRNSLEKAAGETLELVSEQKSVKETLDSELASNTSKYREHSQELWDSRKLTDVEMARKLVKQTLGRHTHLQHSECQEHSQNLQIKQPGLVEATASVEDAEPTAASSDFSKHSQNSLLKSEPKVDLGEAKVTFGDRDGQCLVTVSEFQELSPNSWVETEGSEGRQKKQHTKPVCASEPSEYSQDSLHVGYNVSVPSFSWLKSMSQIVGLTATWPDKVEGNPTAVDTASNAKVNINPVHREFNFFL